MQVLSPQEFQLIEGSQGVFLRACGCLCLSNASLWLTLLYNAQVERYKLHGHAHNTRVTLHAGRVPSVLSSRVFHIKSLRNPPTFFGPPLRGGPNYHSAQPVT